MRVAINGFGRIGRQIFKIALENKINVVAINDLAPLENLVYLLKYDSVYGQYSKKIKITKSGKEFQVGNKKIKVLSEKNPKKLPWKKLKIDYVIESTGLFTDKKDAKKHLKAGAKKVLISAPGKNTDKTIVMGVNDKDLTKSDKIISLASCTTNCLCPVAKVLNDNFGIEKGFLNTVHAYTGTQKTVDSPSKKLRRGRAAGANIIPTTTGATKATTKVLPELKGKLNGLAMRVPVLSGSIIDFTVQLKKLVSVKEINTAFKKAEKSMKGILQYSEDELVSQDIIKNPHSSIIDGKSTQIIGKNNDKSDLIKVLAWYDNEYGYSCRMIDLLKRL